MLKLGTLGAEAGAARLCGGGIVSVFGADAVCGEPLTAPAADGWIPEMFMISISLELSPPALSPAGALSII